MDDSNPPRREWSGLDEEQQNLSYKNFWTAKANDTFLNADDNSIKSNDTPTNNRDTASANDSDEMEVVRYLKEMKRSQDKDSSSSENDERGGHVKVAPAYHLIPVKTAMATPPVATATQ